MPPTAMLARAIEYKNFPFELKSFDEEQGIITGYLSTFGNIDEQKDRVSKGAFKKTIQEAKARTKNGRRFLYPMLWFHSPDQPIGGVKDALEDEHGLLITAQLDISTNAQGMPNNQIATMVFSGFKSGFIDEMSMGYNAIQKEYDSSGVRDLKECRLVEASAITMLFAANPEALVPSDGVKSLYNQANEEIGYIDTNEEGNERYVLFANEEAKAIVGSTSLPIGPRNEAWDGAKAKKQIFAYAKKDDGSFDVAKLKKCFMVMDGDGQQKGSWSYPFVYIKNGNPVICVGAVKAIVAAIGGARNASAPDGLRAKCKTLYNRINKQYPNDPPLTLPDKGNDDEDLEEKDFNSHYADRMAQDVLEDWWDLSCSLKYALIDVFTEGDQPLEDAQTALDQFGPALLAWVQRGIDANLSDYLAAQMQPSTAPSYGYSYMSRQDMPDFKHYYEQIQQERKKGAKIAKNTADQIGGHIDALDKLADQHKSMIKDHRLAMKTLSTVADDLSAVIGRVAYDGDQDEQEESDAAQGKNKGEPRANKAALTNQNQNQQPDNASTANHELAQFQAWLDAKVSSKG
ncbi:MAG: hypothetical protein AUG51_20565 [Acidobacteria bacterium 13_1_20CM_3_53_8]|nr:MAG: hypothetical protein AUG51_20565 [Acidobacteria bacterium 13_1_20CM_3_53_8]